MNINGTLKQRICGSSHFTTIAKLGFKLSKISYCTKDQNKFASRVLYEGNCKVQNVFKQSSVTSHFVTIANFSLTLSDVKKKRKKKAQTEQVYYSEL